jgi:hypothetical protein
MECFLEEREGREERGREDAYEGALHVSRASYNTGVDANCLLNADLVAGNSCLLADAILANLDTRNPIDQHTLQVV